MIPFKTALSIIIAAVLALPPCAFGETQLEAQANQLAAAERVLGNIDGSIEEASKAKAAALAQTPPNTDAATAAELKLTSLRKRREKIAANRDQLQRTLDQASGKRPHKAPNQPKPQPNPQPQPQAQSAPYRVDRYGNYFLNALVIDAKDNLFTLGIVSSDGRFFTAQGQQIFPVAYESAKTGNQYKGNWVPYNGVGRRILRTFSNGKVQLADVGLVTPKAYQTVSAGQYLEGNLAIAGDQVRKIVATFSDQTILTDDGRVYTPKAFASVGYGEYRSGGIALTSESSVVVIKNTFSNGQIQGADGKLYSPTAYAVVAVDNFRRGVHFVSDGRTMIAAMVFSNRTILTTDGLLGSIDKAGWTQTPSEQALRVMNQSSGSVDVNRDIINGIKWFARVAITAGFAYWAVTSVLNHPARAAEYPTTTVVEQQAAAPTAAPLGACELIFDP